MKVVPVARHTVKHVWKAFVKSQLEQHPKYYTKGQAIFQELEPGKVKEIMDYKTFRGIIERFFDQAKKAIIEGEAVQIPCMGAIAAKRISRDFRKEQKDIDWGRSIAKGSEKLENGRMSPDKLYYYTNDDYCRIAWWKPKIANISVYRFEPTNKSSGTREDCKTKGFKTQFSEALDQDPFLKFRYIFGPLRTLVKIEQPLKPEKDGIHVSIDEGSDGDGD